MLTVDMQMKSKTFTDKFIAWAVELVRGRVALVVLVAGRV
jgi:hypothetical protein